ncbi:lymphocyte antigen 75-like isoform X1 [Sinocyclocheilus anshuiensis]|uniref:lymphocyte antigen 75-like isoform X1 n=1 Tax=Sinocyclocheilus anshuiensis TaxID=1608454 RepID=UPI0007BACCB6|nr:PREDICTED: lymphocyte antigen 75-like isoform X1 [Sinocyclocheilus anshuiensis]
MDWSTQQLFYTIIVLLSGESAVHLGSCVSAVINGEDTFAIQHNSSGKCLLVQDGALKLGDCSSVPAVSWKWGSAHRLFHMESSMCLGLEVRSKIVTLFSCDSTEILWWKCYEDIIYTEYQMKLSVGTNDSVTAKRDGQDTWKRGGSSENICQQPYRRMHTSGGNSNGAPCEFPFLYNGTWHHSCLPGTGDKTLDWCSTTANYDLQKKWGNCLKYVEGCIDLWEKAPVKGRCYQVVSTAVVTWHEARDACRSQGGDLLSVSSPQELEFFKNQKDLPSKLWIGLNHLDWMQGWQWSDGSALYFAPWETGIPIRSLMSDEDCGVLKEPLRFGAETCENRLPFICMKNDKDSASTAVREVYKPTACKEGWIGWKGFCYKLHSRTESKLSQHEALSMCRMDDSELASMHSLEDIEMLHTNFHSDLKTEVWIGLLGDGNTSVFEWVDKVPVSFTYWARAQPPPLLPNTIHCVYYSGEHHTWSVSDCEKPRAYMCKSNGSVNESAPEEGCPSDGNWKRHGNACYKVDTELVFYKNSCHITINNRFEQAFINSLLKEHISTEVLYFWTGLQDTKGSREYHWIGQDGTADQVTYTNWKWLEPAFAGGCVVMSTGNPLGQWAVKNCTLFKAGRICKKPIKSMVQPTPDPVEPNLNASCAPGWVSKEGLKNCYMVFHEERLTRKRSWEEAERFCEALGGHLPSFTEAKDMQALHYILRDSISDNRFFWVGLNRRNPNNNNNWEWSDGRPVSMMIFPEEFNEDDVYNRDCVAFKTLKGTYKPFLFLLFHNVPPRPFYPSVFHCNAKLEWVCQIPRGQTPKTPEWYNPDGHHNTSVFIDGQEFWFVAEPKLSFEEAVLYCGSNSSKLAAPDTLNAARRLQERLFEHSEQVNLKWWADLRYPGPHVPFMLSPMHYYYSAFLGRCPSITPVSFEPGFSGKCNEKQPFVCETLNVTSAERGSPEPPPASTPCASTSRHFRKKCYWVLSQSYFQTFKDANEFCKSLTGTMLTISDQVEQDFITTMLPELPGQPQKVWIGLKFKLHDTQWVDNSPVAYLNFNPLLHGQLRPIFINTFEQDSMELCAYMYNDEHSDMMGTWDYTTCSDRQNLSICQHPADEQKEPEHKDDFTVHNHTFKVVQQGNLTWIEALQLCRSYNMDFASVPDAYVQAVLTVEVSRRGQPLWIGLFSEDEGEHYHWTDHSHTEFNRWTSEATKGACVYLDTDGFWKATECEDELSGVICHIPHNETVTPEVDSAKCPHKSNGQNWIRFKENCYTLLLGASRWGNNDITDQQICMSLAGAGEILTIRDEAENDFIRQQLQTFKNLVRFVWLGMNKNKTDEQLKWLDGSNVQFSNWKYGLRPNLTESFIVGLNLIGEWEMITNQRLFNAFKQRSIVVCKIENDTKEEFMKGVVDVNTPDGISYRRVAKRMDWYQALQECGRNRGHLASIPDKTTNDNMALVAKRDGFSLWIGLSKQDVSGWPFEWSDGSAVKFKPDGFVNDGLDSEEKCVFVDSKGTWTAVNCHAAQEGAICYNHISEKTVAHLSSESSSSCPKSDDHFSWVLFKDHCYAFNMYNYSVFTMESAKNVCQNLDSSSKLLTIKSKEENDFVSDYMNKNPSITSRVWLALNVDTNGEPTGWHDGSELDFSSWDANSGPQLSRQTPQICAVMVSSNGSWTHTSCLNSRSRIVCKAPAHPGSPVALIFFIIVLICIFTAVPFILYQKNKHRFHSTVRYQRNFDDVDSASMINNAE